MGQFGRLPKPHLFLLASLFLDLNTVSASAITLSDGLST